MPRYFRASKLARSNYQESGPNGGLIQVNDFDNKLAVNLAYNLKNLDDNSSLTNLLVTPKNMPSSTLQIRINPGRYIESDGSMKVRHSGQQPVLEPNKHAALWILESSGSVSINYTDGDGPIEGFAAWPTDPYIPLAWVITGVRSITSIVDKRVPGLRVFTKLVDAADDIEAMTLDVPLHCRYRTGSVVKIRTT